MALARSDVLPAAADKRAAVREMFDRIAPRYDFLNRLLTGGLDRRWRRRALACVGVGPEDAVVDLACGTGDMAELAAARGARVVGVDFARVMLRGAQARAIRASFVQADGAAIPLANGSVTVLCSGFALRNFVSLPEIFRECARVLARGGRLALLDVDRPRSRWIARAHSLYFDRAVPFVGGLLSDRQAYAYLPESTRYLPPAPELQAMLGAAGFDSVSRRPLLLSTAQILTGVRR